MAGFFGTPVFDAETGLPVDYIYTFQSFFLTLGVSLGILVGLSVLQGFGFYAMAKKRNLKGKWRAFVPFINIHLMGQLAGECSFFGHKMKRTWLYVLITQIASTILCTVEIVAIGVLNMKYAHYPIGQELPANIARLSNYYENSGFLIMIVNFAYEILMLILFMALLKKYYAKGYTMLSVFSFILPIVRYVVIFVVRNNKAIDYEAYMRARREEFIRRQQQYGNPYGRPYGNPYNQGQTSGNQQPKQPQDPFGEFGGNGQSAQGDSPFEDIDGANNQNSGNSEDFFN